jgi:catechol 2,3-dioxygenase-like lactoylglutathione lyase family enzyme
MLNESYWNPLVPELTVSDLKTSLRFYGAVGFTIRFQRENPSFVYLELGQAQLMLEQEHSNGWNIYPLDRPLGRGVNFQIEVSALDCIVEALGALGVQLFREAEETWYAVSSNQEEGQRELLVQDPDGYLLRFTEHLGSRLRDA